MTEGLQIRPGSADDTPALLALFDDAVAWLVARGQTGQWGTEPFSAQPSRVARAENWAASGGLWLAVDQSGTPAGAMVLGDAVDYVPPPERPELYVHVLLTAAAWRGRSVGATLLDHAVVIARARRAEQLRLDCWASVPDLPAANERLGFTRSGRSTSMGGPGRSSSETSESGCAPGPHVVPMRAVSARGYRAEGSRVGLYASEALVDRSQSALQSRDCRSRASASPCRLCTSQSSRAACPAMRGLQGRGTRSGRQPGV
jgi:GNAT superfamily N-acetyltransferase